jgi:thiamine-phosphate pyrophosphorylase
MAARLNGQKKGWPALLFLTDPARTPDPIAVAGRLPKGSGFVYRHFGAPDRMSVARRLQRVCKRRGLVFFIGADRGLAQKLRADGLHLAERQTQRRTYFSGMVTAAAHSRRAAFRAMGAGAQAVLLSPVFPSRSPSAKRPMGSRKARQFAAQSPLPCYALGGVNTKTARTLRNSDFIGLAAIEALID